MRLRKGNAWKGGRVDSYGYIRVWDQENQNYKAEHILIWEKVHNKKLPKGWIIHHLNGVRSDNRPENLSAMRRQDHATLMRPYKARIRELELELSRIKQLNLFAKLEKEKT